MTRAGSPPGPRTTRLRSRAPGTFRDRRRRRRRAARAYPVRRMRSGFSWRGRPPASKPARGGLRRAEHVAGPSVPAERGIGAEADHAQPPYEHGSVSLPARRSALKVRPVGMRCHSREARSGHPLVMSSYIEAGSWQQAHRPDRRANPSGRGAREPTGIHQTRVWRPRPLLWAPPGCTRIGSSSPRSPPGSAVTYAMRCRFATNRHLAARLKVATRKFPMVHASEILLDTCTLPLPPGQVRRRLCATCGRAPSRRHENRRAGRGRDSESRTRCRAFLWSRTTAASQLSASTKRASLYSHNMQVRSARQLDAMSGRNRCPMRMITGTGASVGRFEETSRDNDRYLLRRIGTLTSIISSIRPQGAIASRMTSAKTFLDSTPWNCRAPTTSSLRSVQTLSISTLSCSKTLLTALMSRRFSWVSGFRRSIPLGALGSVGDEPSGHDWPSRIR